jgi:hypothetical protein
MRREEFSQLRDKSFRIADARVACSHGGTESIDQLLTLELFSTHSGEGF